MVDGVLYGIGDASLDLEEHAPSVICVVVERLREAKYV